MGEDFSKVTRTDTDAVVDDGNVGLRAAAENDCLDEPAGRGVGDRIFQKNADGESHADFFDGGGELRLRTLEGEGEIFFLEGALEHVADLAHKIAQLHAFEDARHARLAVFVRKVDQRSHEDDEFLVCFLHVLQIFLLQRIFFKRDAAFERPFYFGEGRAEFVRDDRDEFVSGALIFPEFAPKEPSANQNDGNRDADGDRIIHWRDYTTILVYYRCMSILSLFRKHAVLAVAIGFIVIVVAVLAGRAATAPVPVAVSQDLKKVTLVNAASFRKNDIAVSANGVVDSHSQVDLKSQVSAPVAVINVAIGDRVTQSQIILELQNNDIQAQLSQAQASLLLAEGQSTTGSVSLDSAKQTAIDKIRSAYTQTYGAVVGQADQIIFNNDGNGGRLAAYSTNNALISEITSTDIDLKSSFMDWNAATLALTTATSTSAVAQAISYAKKQMTEADLLLSDILTVLNSAATYATPSYTATINGWKATISGAQASVSGAEQALTGAEVSLNTSASSQGSTAPAQVSIAQAGVTNLEAQLAKTIIRSPIAGTISALPLREGELASPGALLATVIGNSAGLEIKAYVSGDDLSQIVVGTQVNIPIAAAVGATTSASFIKGVVSNVAPSVDATTKQAEVDIDIADSKNSGLVVGQTIAVSIPLAYANGQTSSVYRLPIQNVKIIPGGAYVYVLSASSTIVRNDVVVGAIQGDFIQIVGGLTDGMNIVSPVYGLDEGQKVATQ